MRTSSQVRNVHWSARLQTNDMRAMIAMEDATREPGTSTVPFRKVWVTCSLRPARGLRGALCEGARSKCRASGGASQEDDRPGNSGTPPWHVADTQVTMQPLQKISIPRAFLERNFDTDRLLETG